MAAGPCAKPEAPSSGINVANRCRTSCASGRRLSNRFAYERTTPRSWIFRNDRRPAGPIAVPWAQLRRSLRPRGSRPASTPPSWPGCRTPMSRLHARLMAARAAPDELAAKDESNLLIELARPLEDFIGALFGVAAQAAALRGRHSRLAPLYDCKRLFVQRYVTRAIKPDAALALDGAGVTADVDAAGADSTMARSLGARLRARPSASWSAPSSRSRRRRPRSRRWRATPPGRCTIPRARSAIATGRCSRCRTSSTSSIWCRSRPRSSTASRA